MSFVVGRGVRFVVAGAFNTVFGLLVYSASVFWGAPIWLALIIGIICGIAFNFVTIAGYAFGALSLSRLPRFVSVYVVIYIVNLLGINYLVSEFYDSMRAQAILTIPMALLSYFLMTYWVFAHSK
jgi:putative flippase GtrA